MTFNINPITFIFDLCKVVFLENSTTFGHPHLNLHLFSQLRESQFGHPDIRNSETFQNKKHPQDCIALVN
jgi:hypothetical protein